jgi:hypothetical protein
MVAQTHSVSARLLERPRSDPTKCRAVSAGSRVLGPMELAHHSSDLATCRWACMLGLLVVSSRNCIPSPFLQIGDEFDWHHEGLEARDSKEEPWPARRHHDGEGRVVVLLEAHGAVGIREDVHATQQRQM